MKKYILLLIAFSFVFAGTNVFAQTENVGIGTTTPDASAILELSTDNKGLLIPRLSTADRDANITTPATGLIIYNTTENIFQFYNGTLWIDIISGSITFDRIADGENTSATMQVGAGASLSPSGGTITANAYTGVLPIANGGTNSSTALYNNRMMYSSGDAIIEMSAMTNGQLLIGSDGTAPVLTTLTDGAGINIVEAAGSITISSTNNQIPNGANDQLLRWNGSAWGAQTFSSSSELVIDNTSGIALSFADGSANGQVWQWDGSNWGLATVSSSFTDITAGTNTAALLVGGTLSPSGGTITANAYTGLTANRVLFSDASGNISEATEMTDGQILIGSTGNAPVLTTLSGGTGISIIEAAGSITISSSITDTDDQTFAEVLTEGNQANQNIDMNDGTTSYKIVNLSNPTDAQDAATKNYVDSKALPTGTAEGNILKWNNTTLVWNETNDINITGSNIVLNKSTILGNSTNAGQLLFFQTTNTNLATIQLNALSGHRTYYIPDAGADAEFIMNTSIAGQTIVNGLTITGDIAVSDDINLTRTLNIEYDASNPQIKLDDESGSYTSSFKTGTQTATYDYIFPIDDPVEDEVLTVKAITGTIVELEWDDECCGGGGTIDLDGAYSNGRSISVDAGAVQLNGSLNSDLLYLANAAASTGNYLTLNNGTDDLLVIDYNGDLTTRANISFYDGSWYSTFTQGIQTEDVTYTLPNNAPLADQILSSTAGGQLSWVTPAAGSTLSLNNAYDDGAGSTITVDNGAIQFTGSNAADETLEITTTGDGGLLYLKNEGAGDFLNFDNSTTTNIINIDNNGNFTTRANISFYDGTNSTTFTQGTQTADITYTLPDAAPTANDQVLASTTAGQLSWITPSGGGSGSLDDAYDNGVTITVDNGAIQFTGSNAADETLEITTSDNGGLLYLQNGGTGDYLKLNNGTSDLLVIDDEANMTSTGFVHADSLYSATGGRINNNLYVNDTLVVADSLFVGGNAKFNDSVFVEQSLIVKDSLYVGGDVEFNKKLFIKNIGGGNGSYYLAWDQTTGEVLYYTGSSSIRFKKDIVNLPEKYDINNIIKLRPVAFRYKKNNRFSIGLIAEEVEEYFPEMVNYDKDGKIEGLKYEYVSILLLEYAKEQDARISKMEDDIKELKKMLNLLMNNKTIDKKINNPEQGNK